jgi:NitT/TauT family transport system substrate-binding protein
LAPRIGATNPGALDVYRQRFLEGIPRRPLADEAADAKTLYHVLADIGGAELVGPSRDFDPGIFYGAARSE